MWFGLGWVCLSGTVAPPPEMGGGYGDGDGDGEGEGGRADDEKDELTEAHAHTGAQNLARRREHPERRRVSPAQEHVADWLQGEEKGVGDRAGAQDPSRAESALEPGEEGQDPDGLRGASDADEEHDESGGEAPAAELDGGEVEDRCDLWS